MSEPARLYLITPVVAEAGLFVSALTAALRAADVACVLLRTPAHDDGRRRKVAAALTPLVQEQGAALLLEDDTRAAAAVGADGVHLRGPGDDLDQALRSMKPDRIVGAGQLLTRDDAMMAGESGVDYLLFGDDAEVPPLDARVAHVAWWAEIFQVPCVAWAHSLDEVEPLATAGADFIALADAVWTDPRGPGAAVAAAAAVLEAVAQRASLAGSEQV
ncbi:thiamine phosphate synthase [Lichenifustis flavocetrariae]|uniref:Thiamine phosphate synthase n=1 Tax=Lichenifustis flavocetrariae TaxID=2949735 RepID=A0AA41YXC5_9HYPH|nr:thiamine phosphate synthase [Lichenifustis flavocetrariae]MCW6510319.1 thiamine phosphate synthase [Lichenifustis flavocetrariae]